MIAVVIAVVINLNTSVVLPEMAPVAEDLGAGDPPGDTHHVGVKDPLVPHRQGLEVLRDRQGWALPLLSKVGYLVSAVYKNSGVTGEGRNRTQLKNVPVDRFRPLACFFIEAYVFN